MSATSKFEILRRNPSPNISKTYPSAAVRGLAVGIDGSDPNAFVVAQHNNFVGFLTRDVVAGGLTLTDRVFGRSSTSPVGVEGPFTAGESCSAEKADAIEVEGTDYLYSGTGQITEAHTVPQSLSLKDGKWRIAQNGEVVRGTLVANNLDCETPATGTLRVRIELI